jgi:hypothetical protein
LEERDVKEELEKKVEDMLSKIKSNLGGADVRLDGQRFKLLVDIGNAVKLPAHPVRTGQARRSFPAR